MAKTTPSDDHALPSLALVFGYIAVKELQRLEDKVAVLTRLGYGAVEIARICDTSVATVYTMRLSSKKAKQNRRRKHG